MLPKDLVYLIHEFVCVRRLIDWTTEDYHNTAHNLTMMYLRNVFKNPNLRNPSTFLHRLKNQDHYEILDRLQNNPRTELEDTEWCMMMLKGPLEYEKTLAVWVFMQEATWFAEHERRKEAHICAEWIDERYHRIKGALQGW